MERIWKRSRLIFDRSLRGNTLVFRNNKTTADGKENPLRKQSSFLVESRKAHAVGMRNNISDGIHLIATENQVLSFFEGDGVETWQVQGSGSTNRGEHRFDLTGIDAFRRLTGQPKEDGPISAMSMTG